MNERTIANRWVIIHLPGSKVVDVLNYKEKKSWTENHEAMKSWTENHEATKKYKLEKWSKRSDKFGKTLLPSDLTWSFINHLRQRTKFITKGGMEKFHCWGDRNSIACRISNWAADWGKFKLSRTFGLPSMKYFFLSPPTTTLAPNIGTMTAREEKVADTILSSVSRRPISI